MAHKFIVCNPTICNGCRICELACSMTKEGVFNSQISRIHNVRIEPVLMLSISCRACEEPACIKVCQRQALQRLEETGTIAIDNPKCDGCGWCIEACKFGVITLNPSTKKVVMCDLCLELPKPKCVEFCPKEALSLSTPEIVAEKMRKEAIEALLHDFLKCKEGNPKEISQGEKKR